MASTFQVTTGSAAMSESTRYLCVGAYIDEDFAEEAQHQFDMADFQALPPCYGVDLGRLQHHTKQARALVGRRDAVIFVSWLIALITAPVVAVAWVLVMKAATAMARSVGNLPGVTGGRSVRVPGMHTWRTTLGGGLRVQSPLWGLMKALAFWLILVVIAGALLGPLSVLSMLPRPLIVVMILVCLVIVPWLAAWRQQQEVWQALKTLGPQRQPAAGPPPGNTVIYSGFRPFVGSGEEMHSWALDLRLAPDTTAAGTPVATTRFDAGELLTALRAGLEALKGPRATTWGSPSPHLTKVPGLAVREQLFVHGRDLLDGPAPFTTETFLGSSRPDAFRPVTGVRDETVAAARGNTEGPVRHCLTAQVQSWEGDIILSVHVQAAVTEHTVHLYSTASVLAPVREAYRQVDRMTAAHSLEHRLRLMASALSAAQDGLARPVARIVRHLLGDYFLDRRRRQLREMIRYDKRYDFGGRQSLRERAASPDYANYFQRIDVRRFNSQIELRVLSTLKTLFEQHGWDAGELDEGRKVILNNGIIMTGGAMQGAIAAGTGAHATASGDTARGPARALSRLPGARRPGSGQTAAAPPQQG